LHGSVRGLENVYAAGDLTTFPVKQGGIAAQQADAAAESIAASAGAEIEPQPFTPVLRGLLLTGLTPRYLRSEQANVRSAVDTEPLWWPPAKIVGRHLAPFLASQLQITESPAPASGERIAVDVDLKAHVP
jgi:sulfide:quinone oxidoreductase